jgi:hypothetical protein
MEDILNEFNLPTEEDFFRLCEEESNLNHIAGRLCKLMRLERHQFREMYRFKRANPNFATSPIKIGFWYWLRKRLELL